MKSFEYSKSQPNEPEQLIIVFFVLLESIFFANPFSELGRKPVLSQKKIQGRLVGVKFETNISEASSGTPIAAAYFMI